MSWDTIEGAESYLIYYEIEGASDPSRVVLDAGVSPLTLTNTEIQLQGLEPGVTLTLEVAALAAGGSRVSQANRLFLYFFDGDEPDSAESPIVVTENGMTSRSIEPSSDEDFFEFTIYVSSNVTLETSGTSGDSKLYLYDESGNQIAYNDDGGIGFFSRIDTSVEPGTYLAKVSNYTATSAVIPLYSFNINVDPGDAFNACRYIECVEAPPPSCNEAGGSCNLHSTR